MSLRLLRPAALTAALIGAVGSVGLVLRAGRTTPRLVLVLMVIWVLAPFAALAWANIVAKRLYWLTLVVALGSLASYGSVIVPPAGSPRGFMFVIVPGLSWLLIVIAVVVLYFYRSRDGTTP
jgi:phosphate/sulfate permease